MPASVVSSRLPGVMPPRYPSRRPPNVRMLWLWRRPSPCSAIGQKKGRRGRRPSGGSSRPKFESAEIVFQPRQAGVGRFPILGAQGSVEFSAAVPENDAKRVASLLDGCHVAILPVGCGKNQRHKSNAKATLSPICPQRGILTRKKGLTANRRKSLSCKVRPTGFEPAPHLTGTRS